MLAIIIQLLHVANALSIVLQDYTARFIHLQNVPKGVTGGGGDNFGTRFLHLNGYSYCITFFIMIDSVRGRQQSTL